MRVRSSRPLARDGQIAVLASEDWTLKVGEGAFNPSTVCHGPFGLTYYLKPSFGHDT